MTILTTGPPLATAGRVRCLASKQSRRPLARQACPEAALRVGGMARTGAGDSDVRQVNMPTLERSGRGWLNLTRGAADDSVPSYCH